MPYPRLLAFVIAVATPAVAYRLGGPSLWTAYAAGLTVAAALAAYALSQDDLLRDVMLPRRNDIALGAAGSAVLYLGVFFAFMYVIAPVREAGGLLNRCTADGVRLPRLEPHGVTRALEWMRVGTCRAYAQSLGITGPFRGLLVVLIAAMEEIAWRGGVQQGLSEKLGSTRGWVAASVLYAVAHVVTGNGVIVLLALPAGFLWGALYRFRGRLAPGIFSHAVFSYFLFHAQPLVSFM